jgi:hypothetical protein
MNALADLAIKAHGGIDRWNELKQVKAHQLVGGMLWSLKEADGIINDTYVTVDLHHERASHSPFTGRDLHSVLEPNRVAIESLAGEVVEERLNPRQSFAGHTLETPWDRLQLAYFAGYAMWTYLTTPFIFAFPGVTSEEIEPWQENVESWRRLLVSFPDTIATHSRQQTFYFDKAGILRRHDYDVEIAGGSQGAHYVFDHKIVDGILVPTKRTVFVRQADNTPDHNIRTVTIELREIVFS